MPFRQAQGPELVEGQAISARNREYPPSPRLWRDKNSLLQNPAVIDRRYKGAFGVGASGTAFARSTMLCVSLLPARRNVTFTGISAEVTPRRDTTDPGPPVWPGASVT